MSDPVSTAAGLPFDEAIRYLASKTNRTSETWTDVWGKAHSKAFAVAGAATDAIVADFREAVTRAIADGESIQQFRKRFDEIVRARGWTHTGSAGWRARVIYETNLATAYAAGRYVEMKEPETLAAFPYWQYVHSGKKHYREQHKAWNGTVLRADDPFWSWAYPPNGYNCGCWVRPLSERGLSRIGRSAPDPSPPRERYRYLVKKTGELKPATIGIDPGFDRNPGEEWAAIRATMGPQPPPAIPTAPSPAWRAPPTASSAEEVEAVDAELRAAFRAWATRLAAAELEAVDGYKGTRYIAMNEHLRGLSPAAPKAVVDDIKRLDAALARAETPRDIELQRGLGRDDAMRSLRPGQSIRYNSFASFSAAAERPRSFAKGDPPVIVVARLPKGYKGAAYIHDVPFVKHSEHEVLIRPGSTFRCIDRIETDQEIRIVVEAVNEPGRRARLTPRRTARAGR